MQRWGSVIERGEGKLRALSDELRAAPGLILSFCNEFSNVSPKTVAQLLIPGWLEARSSWLTASS